MLRLGAAGIGDPRAADKRIDFVGGIRGLKALERRVDYAGKAGAFSLFPPRWRISPPMADAGEVMLPKSTRFQHKLADRLVSPVLD